MQRTLLISFFMLLFLAACQSPPPEENAYVTFIENAVEKTFTLPYAMTVEEFLSQANIVWDENDRIVPPLYTQVTNGTRITIVRVDEEEKCEMEVIPFQDQRVPNQGFQPGDERVQRQGQNGEQRVCYRISYENGVQQQRIQLGEPEIITEPVDRIIIYGVERVVEPIPITGNLAYLNNSNAWLIRGSSTDNKPLTVSSDLDSMVFALSLDGRYLLFTREAQETAAFVNELWAVDTTNPEQLIQLSITDVLYAEWLPTPDYSISYSTGQVYELQPGWTAFNNLFISRIDPLTGDFFNPRLIVEDSCRGLYCWWGTVFDWSPDGLQLAWAQAEAIGLYNADNEPVPLTNFDSFRNLQEWSWRANLSWSWDASLIATVIHGPSAPNQPTDTSPIFSVVVLDTEGNFEAMIAEGAGMWAQPQFSPQLETPDNLYPQGYLAYLRAKIPNEPVYGEYELVVADRDGSNARVLFPPENQEGIRWGDSQHLSLSPRMFTWSPDGRQIALIYQGNLYIIDVATEDVYQMTFDGGSENPVWSR
jgi:resuscitation-promoting factor RpfB